MFKLFKSSDAIVREIHNEVDTAQDRLLKEADEVLADFKGSDLEKLETLAERHKRIGFNNTKTVEKVSELKVKNKHFQMKQTEAELLRYYKQAYPFEKFLTEKELDRICEKYNLIYAPVKNYIEDIPEKNLIEIENSSPLKSSDWAKEKRVFCYIDKFTSEAKSIHKKQLAKGIDITDIADWFMNNNDVCKIYFGVNYNICHFSSFGSQIEKQNRDGLFIAAPKSHFNLEELTKKTKHGFFSVELIQQKDPIVFEFCRGNMVRVKTKWGIEAEDKDLVNEKLN